MEYIRKYVDSDLNEIMKIWYNGNLEAHDFIDKKYWDDNFNYVKRRIPQVDVYVYECNGEVVGFVGMDEDYLSGLFVKKEFRGLGFGSRLLRRVMEENDKFTLHVFEKNYGAYIFYERHGLINLDDEVNEDLGEVEFIMEYQNLED